MVELFSDETRRNPYPLYAQLRSRSPLFHDPVSNLWMVFDYDGVKRVLTDHESFSSRHGPVEWMIFLDPPRHSKVRALVAQAFTPRSVTDLEPRIRELAGALLGRAIQGGEMDMAADLSVPLPMMVIAEMLGLPLDNGARYEDWNNVILKMSHTFSGGQDTANVVSEFKAVTAEMEGYLGTLLEQRRSAPRNDLLTRLVGAEVEGQRLTLQEILGFFQLLLLAGSETTTDLLNNAILCFIENPEQLAQLRAAPVLLPSAIEEVLRYRSPLQWMFRKSTREVELHGQKIPAGQVILVMMGSANHDAKQFPDAGRFDIARNPNAHVAFGQGIHFCLGAALARLEAKVALMLYLDQVEDFGLASREPWEPRKGLHVLGPTRLPLWCKPRRQGAEALGKPA